MYRSVLTVCGFLLWSNLSALAAPSDNDRILRKLEVFAKVLNYVEANYVKEVNSEELIYSAIDGLLANLDPHTMLLRPEIYREMKTDTTGEYGGLGLEITARDKSIVVVSPVEGSPADREGIEAGDQILMIDGISTENINLADTIEYLRGNIGTKVKLTIRALKNGLMREVVLKREKIKLRSVFPDLLDKRYGYLKIRSFQERTVEDVIAELNTLEKESQGLHGVILDLRNNPGGLLEQAIQMADLFLKNGVIVSTSGRRETFGEVRRAQAESTLPYKPMVLMVNEGSASASEIVAGALQDHKRALIIGTPTFGKGSVQTIIDLDDGSALKLTVAKYLTPHGTSIQATGITPDIVVEPNTPFAEAMPQISAVREVDLDNHLLSDQEKGKVEAKVPGLDIEKDVQLKTALYHLKTWSIFKSYGP